MLTSLRGKRRQGRKKRKLRKAEAAEIGQEKNAYHSASFKRDH
jgi:hypothetical protein